MSINVELIANSLLESVRVAAQLLLNATQQKVVDTLIDDVEIYVALLGRAVSRYQTVSEMIKVAKAENRDLTDEEMKKIHGMLEDMQSKEELLKNN